MEQYYIIEDETKKGPFSLKELIELDLFETARTCMEKRIQRLDRIKKLSEY